jgi:hypothetical protein
MMLICSFCRFTQAALKLDGGEKCCNIGRLSTGVGSRMLQSLILIDALSSAYWEKKGEKTEKEREMARGLFSQGQTCLAGCAAWDFCSC